MSPIHNDASLPARLCLPKRSMSGVTVPEMNVSCSAETFAVQKRVPKAKTQPTPAYWTGPGAHCDQIQCQHGTWPIWQVSSEILCAPTAGLIAILLPKAGPGFARW